MASIGSSIEVRLIGPLMILDRKGQDLTPRGRKSCAIIALLCMSPGFRRSRKWLQDKLWSDRGEEQGAASLRQCLAEIRRSLGDDKWVVRADRQFVWFEQDAIKVESLEVESSSDLTDQILLDGLDIRDIEFENWLRDVRLDFIAKQQQIPETALQLPTERLSESCKLILDVQSATSSNFDSMAASELATTVGGLVREATHVEVIAASKDGHVADTEVAVDTVRLLSRASQTDNGEILHLSLVKSQNNSLLWSTALKLDENSETLINAPHVLGAANTLAAMAIEEFSRSGAKALVQRAIKLLFRHGMENYTLADDLFREASMICPRGLFYAWRAYLRSFIVAEKLPQNVDQYIEEAIEFMKLALDAEPHNSLVLSLCAHVKSTIELSHVGAYELAKRSINLNPANAMGWVSMGMAESHLGRPQIGFAHCQYAVQVTGTSPFKNHIDILSCIVGVMSGDIDAARHHGEAAHCLAPELAVPLRFLSAIYASQRDDKRLFTTVSKLQTVEPNFSLRVLRDTSYPVESLRRSEIVRLLPA